MRTRDEVKEQTIRQKAISMIVEYGLDGFSMQKLAKEAQVSPATLYIYYKDKEDLLLKIGIDATIKMMEYSLRDFDPDMHFEEGLRLQWINRVRFFMENPMEVEFIEMVRYTPMHKRIREELTICFSDVMGKFVRNAIERNELIKLPFEVYWSVAFAPLYQLIKFHSQGESYVNTSFSIDEKSMTLTLQLVLKALKPG